MIGRWNVMDPLAEKYYPYSAYNYALNDPIGKLDVATAEGWSTNDPSEIAEFMQQVQGDDQDKGGKKKNQQDPPQKKLSSEEFEKQKQESIQWQNETLLEFNKALLGIRTLFVGFGGEKSLRTVQGLRGGWINFGNNTGSLVIEAGGKFSQSEINAANYLKDQGYRVFLRRPVGTRTGGKTSDLVVNGINYDVYTPQTSNVNRIISAVASKNSQTTGVVIDLSNTSVVPSQLNNILNRVQGTGATNIKNIIIMPK
ncbi:hypothetical protein [Sphingobacterium spiritivorum]|uniref:CdiA C-terminal domain-containing protein n=1 Tax=Sphingobacterium spiritivorum TaxID=258 RepID=UPI00191901DB|nr:hypothetical protein [Sphingobacterium spiritivorum]QQT26618.1 hypothetical protein I6J02_01795 [Sphingobacterium spiritivorum]